MKRREFIIGGAAAWPLVARAQQGEKMRRVGVLEGQANDPPIEMRHAIFGQALEKLGWSPRNIRIDYRFAGGRVEQAQAFAKELVSLQPDVIFTTSTLGAGALQRVTHANPIAKSNRVLQHNREQRGH
jgi:putative tryptophan/tyrosine transport system substrate-binding protein